jgi:hypothetical protein
MCSKQCWLRVWLFSSTILIGRKGDGRQAETGAYSKRMKPADWLTRTRDFKCAEPFKSRPPSASAVGM